MSSVLKSTVHAYGCTTRTLYSNVLGFDSGCGRLLPPVTFFPEHWLAAQLPSVSEHSDSYENRYGISQATREGCWALLLCANVARRASARTSSLAFHLETMRGAGRKQRIGTLVGSSPLPKKKQISSESNSGFMTEAPRCVGLVQRSARSGRRRWHWWRRPSRCSCE